jgi:hypothetical protein
MGFNSIKQSRLKLPPRFLFVHKQVRIKPRSKGNDGARVWWSQTPAKQERSIELSALVRSLGNSSLGPPPQLPRGPASRAPRAGLLRLRDSHPLAPVLTSTLSFVI